MERWLQEKYENLSDASGFVAYAFANESQKRVVIAIRGSDNAADWSGPNLALARDGELLDLLGLPSPGTDRTRAQMASIQEKLLPGDAWDPQFREALDFALKVQDTYGAQGYRIEVVGHSLGGAHAQVLSHTFGWDGRSFDAPGAANIVQSQGYRQWLEDNGATPSLVPRFRPSFFAADGTGFLNYEVNNSVVSKKSGPHLGESQSISSFTGREGLASHTRYAAGVVGGAINETPLLRQALKTMGGARLASTIGHAAHGSHHGIDAPDRHGTDRIVAVFEEAVRRQERGDRQPLPIWGHHDVQDPKALAGVTQCRPLLAQASLEQQQRAVRSLFDGPDDGPFARFFDATMAGDADAVRRVARELCAGPEATAWLQSGRERLKALEQAGAGSHQAIEATAEVSRQDDGVPPLGPERMC
ncbi:hypothetical protein ACW5F0_08780 [Luteimonas sp. A534]